MSTSLVISQRWRGVCGYRDIKKRKGAVKEAKAKKAKAAKKVKDPNAPKRPQTAFFIFL